MQNFPRIWRIATTRNAWIIAFAAAVLGGCTSSRAVTTPRSGTAVRIEYPEPVTLTMQTRQNEALRLTNVRVLYVRILEVRGDSVNVRVLATTPYDRRIEQATATIEHPRNSARKGAWTERKMSAGKTAALIFVPIFIFAAGGGVAPE